MKKKKEKVSFLLKKMGTFARVTLVAGVWHHSIAVFYRINIVDALILTLHFTKMAVKNDPNYVFLSTITANSIIPENN